MTSLCFIDTNLTKALKNAIIMASRGVKRKNIRFLLGVYFLWGVNYDQGRKQLFDAFNK